MEVFSVNLWTILSSFIGTEEQVLIRRRKHDLFSTFCSQHMLSDKKIRMISSGSRAEGLNFDGSDYDMMYVISILSVYTLSTINGQQSVIVMETGNIKPGFVRLHCKDCIRNDALLKSALVETTNGLYLSSLLFRDIVVAQNPGSVAHGPCASYTEVAFHSVVMEIDTMICLSSNTWPAMKWRYRRRNQNWPSQTLIEEIIQEGCLLVPIGNPNSQNSFMEWRLSFSLAEKKLINSFNHTQLLCYGLLKLYLKHVINSNDEVKKLDLLCSYFLKTSLFFCIEEEDISWSKENLFDCFFTCFRRLLKWVQQGYCPNYFIKENNMFEGKIFGPKQRILLQYLSKLDAEEHQTLKMIPCICKLYRESFHTNIVFQINQHGKEYVCDTELNDIVSPFPDTFSVKEVINYFGTVGRMMQETTLGIDKCIMNNWLKDLSALLIQHMYSDAVRCTSNKTRYKEIKGLKRFIIYNCPHVDEVTRMLLLATLCYINRNYNNVVEIITDVLRKHGRYMTMMGNHQAYMDEICGKGLTKQQKIHVGLFSYALPIHVNCGLFPKEIESELFHYAFKSQVLIPTVVYSKILMFLCYFHLTMKQNMNSVLNDLYVAVHIDNMPRRFRHQAISLLEKCLQIADTH